MRRIGILCVGLLVASAAAYGNRGAARGREGKEKRGGRALEGKEQVELDKRAERRAYDKDKEAREGRADVSPEREAAAEANRVAQPTLDGESSVMRQTVNALGESNSERLKIVSELDTSYEALYDATAKSEASKEESVRFENWLSEVEKWESVDSIRGVKNDLAEAVQLARTKEGTSLKDAIYEVWAKQEKGQRKRQECKIF